MMRDELVDLDDVAPEVMPAGASARIHSPKVVLDPRDPIKIARTLVGELFTVGDVRSIHHYRGGFYRWNGSCYRPVDSDAVRSKVWTFLEGIYRPGANDSIQPFKPTRARVGDVLDALAAVSNLPNDVEAPIWLDGSESKPLAGEMLPVVNGLLHLPTGHLLKPSPSFFGLNASTLHYDHQAPQPDTWRHFLAEIFEGDSEAVGSLQDFIGYLLTPDTSQQKILLIVGPPRSGKGTLARVITELVGRDNVASPTLASLSSNFGLEPLIGKPVAIVSDARLGNKSDQAAIAERLLSISGEDGLTIDRKYLSAWTGRLPTRFIICSNELPRLADASGALANRFIVLTMQKSFLGKEDPGLTNKLLAELPGILNWAREGYLRMRQRQYFIQPFSAREAMEELDALGSPVKAFVRERCSVGPGQRVLVSSLYEAWCSWCGDTGRQQPGTRETFGRDLKAAYHSLKVTQTRDIPGRPRCYEGISISIL